MNINSDLKSYRSLLCRVASYSDREDFQQVFKAIMDRAGIDKKTSFILKMELTRLQKKCNITIDLRGHVDGECEAFYYNEVTHYLDDIAKAVFEEMCVNFKGYTIGVYESVNNTVNNYRVMHEKEKLGITDEKEHVTKPKTLAPVLFDTVEFNNFHIRKEERMHYVSDIYAIENDVDFHIGKSIDISVSGCQLKINKDYMPEVGSTIEILFKKLNEEFELSLKSNLKYKVVSFTYCEDDENYNILRLKRESCKNTLGFDEFLGNYIIGNKRRYKVNLDNTIDSVYSRGYSQCSLPRRMDLSLLVKEEISGTNFLAIATETNRSTMEFWKDHDNELIVSQVFTGEKLAKLKSKLKNGSGDSYLYVFNGINSAREKVFYAGFKEDFQGNEQLLKSFCKIGIENYEFRIFNVSLSESDSKYAYQPFSLVTENIEVFKRINKKPSARVMKKLANISYVLSIRDITTQESIEDYLFENEHKIDLHKIKDFKLITNRQKNTEILPIKSLDIRKENRYKIKTDAIISFEKAVMKGCTVDLSTKGLKVKVSEDEVIDSNIFKGIIVSIDLPNYNLSKLKYKVVHHNKENREYSLVVHGDVLEHKGRIFLRDLFNKNKNNLLDYQTGDQNGDLASCIQNILTSSSTNLSAYLTKKGNRSIVKKVSLGNNDELLTKRLVEDRKIKLGFLHDENIYRPLINDQIKREIETTNMSNSKNIYVSIEEGKVRAISESKLSTPEMRKMFIKKALRNGKFHCVNASFSKAGRPDMTNIGVEINYISMYSMHKGKDIEDELWSIRGIIDLKDITEEALHRNLPM